MARRVAVPDRVLGMGLLHLVDYQDSYIVDAPTGFRGDRSADALTALAFGSIPAWVRKLIAMTHRRVLRVRLDLPSTVPVPGWQRLRDEPDEAVYGADGPLITLRLVVSATATTVGICTLVRFHRRPARLVWTVVGPVHRLIARVLLTRGVAAATPPIR